MKNLQDGTALGCIGRCKRCGKAIQLRRTTMFNWDDKSITPGDHDMWAHFTNSDHPAELNPGVCDILTCCPRGHGLLENGDCPDCGFST